MVDFSGLGLMTNFLQLRNRAVRQDLVVEKVKLVCKEGGQLNLVCLMSLLIYFGLSFHKIRISALDKPNVIFNLILILKASFVELLNHISFFQVNLLP
jgi:hypothetical protein